MLKRFIQTADQSGFIAVDIIREFQIHKDSFVPQDAEEDKYNVVAIIDTNGKYRIMFTGTKNLCREMMKRFVNQIHEENQPLYKLKRGYYI